MLISRSAKTPGTAANQKIHWRTSKRCLLALAALAAILVAAKRVPAQIPPLPPEKVVEILGQHIHYYEAGVGETVILLHGLGASADIWAANIPALAAHYRVVVPDQLGFGNSDKPLIEYKIQTWVEFLDMFMRALNIPKATVVGNSLGGWIAVDFARQHPDKVVSLVLTDAGGWRPIDMPPPLAKGVNSPSEAGIRQALEMTLFERQAIPIDLNPGSLAETRTMLEFIVSNKQFVTDQMVAQEFARHLKISDGYTVDSFLTGSLADDQFENEKLSHLSLPTLIIWGKDDRLFPLEIGRRYSKAIAGSKFVVIDQAGHVPQLEKSADFNSALLAFLGGS